MTNIDFPTDLYSDEGIARDALLLANRTAINYYKAVVKHVRKVVKESGLFSEDQKVRPNCFRLNSDGSAAVVGVTKGDTLCTLNDKQVRFLLRVNDVIFDNVQGDLFSTGCAVFHGEPMKPRGF